MTSLKILKSRTVRNSEAFHLVSEHNTKTSLEITDIGDFEHANLSGHHKLIDDHQAYKVKS